MMTQEFRSLLATWETKIKFLGPGFGCQGHLGSELAHKRSLCSVSLSQASPSCCHSASEINK